MATRDEKKCDDSIMFSRFDKISACDRQMDRETDGPTDGRTFCDSIVRAMHSIARLLRFHYNMLVISDTVLIMDAKIVVCRVDDFFLDDLEPRFQQLHKLEQCL